MAKLATERKLGGYWGYLLAVAATAALTALRWGLEPIVGDTSPYVLFYLSVALAAVVGGTGPGVLALGLAGVTATLLFVPPRHSLALGDRENVILLVQFLITGGILVLLAGWAKRSRRSAQQHADFADSLLEGMDDGYFAIDSGWRITDTNRQAERILGKPRAEFVGKDVRDWPPGWKTHFRQESERAMRDRAACRFEELCPITGKWLDISIYPAHGGLAVFFRDITERRRAEEALRHSEARFRGMVQAVPSLTFEADAEGNNTFVSERWCEYTGVTAERAAGAGWVQTLHPEEAEAIRKRWGEIVLAGEPFESKGRLRARDGSYRWFLFRAQPVCEAGGRIVRWAGSLTEIDELIQTEEALRASEEFSRRLLASSYDCIKTLDIEGNLLSMAERGRRLMEIEDLGSYLHKPYVNFWMPEDYPMVEEALAAARAGSVGSFEGFSPTVTGRPRWWDVRVSPVPGPDGRPERLLVIARDTTEATDAREALRRSEERLRLVNAVAEIGTYDADVRIHSTVYSPELCAILGVPPDYIDWPPERGLDFVHPDDRAAVEAAIARASNPAGDGVSRMELRIVRPNAEVRWIGWSGRTFFEDTPKGRVPVRAIGACIDITERKAAEQALREHEQALRESEEKFRSLAENMRAAVGMVQGTRFIYVNRYMATALGYSIDELLGVDFPTLVRADFRNKLLELARRRQAGELVPGNYEFPAITKNGEERWFDFSPSRIVYKGQPAIVGAGFDITHRKQMETALRESEEKFRLLAENSKVMIAILRDRRLLYVNPCIRATSGYTEQELLSLDVAELISPAERELVLDRACRRQRGEVLEPTDEYQLVDKSGELHWVQLWPVRIIYQGSPAILTSGIDVTDRRHTEETLRGMTHGLKLLADNATRLLRTERPQDILQEIFTELAQNLDIEICINYFVSRDRPGIQMNCSVGVDEVSRRQIDFLEFGQGVCGTVAQTGEHMVVKNIPASREPITDALRALEIKAYACYPMVAHGRVVGTLAFGTRRRNEFPPGELDLMRAVADQVALAMERQQLLGELEKRAEELARANHAKDNFLAILSHELRTPLTPVLAIVAMLQEEMGLDPQTLDSLEVIHRNVELEARLIDDLLDLTRIARGKIELNKTHADLCSIISRAVEVCKPDMQGRQLHFRFDCPGGPFWVEADVGRLQQVFWNLIKNSVKFTPNGGCIGIRCDPASDGFVIVDVTDSGEGIESEALGRIFNAFEQAEKTRTGQFGGLGLGLAISKALVELHGGNIEVYSAGKGKGSTFRVRVPMVALPVSPAESPGAAAPEVKGPPLRILLVEDHGDTARVWKRLLERRGHKVETVSDVASALPIASSEEVDLIISDLGLPDASGLDLMRELHQRRPGLKGIALSGYGMESDLERSREAGFSEHLTKPVDPDTLQAAILRVASSGN